jgi:hypothetical protein
MDKAGRDTPARLIVLCFTCLKFGGMRGERSILMQKILGWWLGIVVMGLPMGSIAASATTSGAGDPSQIVLQADLIVEAVATDRAGVWIDGTLYTAVDLEVLKVLKGHPPGRTVLLLPGGVDLDREIPIAVRWPGAPELGTGEKALLFLNRSSDPLGAKSPYYSIFGFFRGKLSIRNDGEDLVVADPSNASGGTRPLTAVEAEIRRTLAMRDEETR